MGHDQRARACATLVMSVEIDHISLATLYRRTPSASEPRLVLIGPLRLNAADAHQRLDAITHRLLQWAEGDAGSAVQPLTLRLRGKTQRSGCTYAIMRSLRSWVCAQMARSPSSSAGSGAPPSVGLPWSRGPGPILMPASGKRLDAKLAISSTFGVSVLHAIWR